LKVLIGDDSEITLDRMTLEIEKLAVVDKVWQAIDVSSTLQSIQLYKPDVVILDIKMPDGSGLDVLEIVKSWEDPPIVVIYTFYPYPQHRKRAFEAGADYFFDKTKDFLEIIDTIETIGKSLNYETT
jgi:DNA-binding NarL/FixJ family response regulator